MDAMTERACLVSLQPYAPLHFLSLVVKRDARLEAILGRLPPSFTQKLTRSNEVVSLIGGSWVLGKQHFDQAWYRNSELVLEIHPFG